MGSSKENTAEFTNFPDSNLYMIGFKYKQQSAQPIQKELPLQKKQVREAE